jgi:hypothetical protein
MKVLRKRAVRACLYIGLAVPFGLVASGGASSEPQAGAETIEQVPQQTLTNGLLKVTVLLPDATKGYYRGTRFDWSGLISRVEYKGHSFFGEWRFPHNPTNHDDAVGPADEFGIEKPPGYAETPVGGSFLKIGVGELQKPEEPRYQFWRTYKLVKPGSWKIKTAPGSIEFTQEMALAKDKGYKYVKLIELAKDGPSFRIHHQLKNMGSQRLSVEEYCHNFVVIDGTPIGRAYHLTFGFPPRPKDESSLKERIRFTGKKMIFEKDLQPKDSHFAEILGLTGTVEDNAVTIENTKSGGGVRIIGNRAPSKFNFYAERTAVCPEPFIKLDLPQSAEATWDTEYAFSASADRYGSTAR